MSRILLMDDEVVQAMELAAKLRESGYEVVTVHSAEEARKELWYWDFDCLITDIVVRREGRAMPDGGFALILWVKQKLAATPGLRELPVIAISGAPAQRGLEFVLPTASRIGADAVFEKPVSFTELEQKLREIVHPVQRPEALEG